MAAPPSSGSATPDRSRGTARNALRRRPFPDVTSGEADSAVVVSASVMRAWRRANRSIADQSLRWRLWGEDRAAKWAAFDLHQRSSRRSVKIGDVSRPGAQCGCSLAYPGVAHENFPGRAKRAALRRLLGTSVQPLRGARQDGTA